MNDLSDRLLRLGWTLALPGSGLPTHRTFTVKSVGLGGDHLIGLEATTAGRFGNAIAANISAIEAALALGIPHVRLCKQEGFRKTFCKKWNDLIVYSGDLDIGDGLVLCGPFADPAGIVGRNQPPPGFKLQCAQELLRYALDLDDARLKPAPDEIVIHIRSGDLFDSYVHPDYVQPPLSFYKLMLADALREEEIRRVTLVYEDLKNPCVKPLMDHIQQLAIPHRFQSSSLKNDIGTILDSRHLCFGFGTFVPSISMMSPQLASGRFFVLTEEDAVKRFVWIKRRYAYLDAEGGYIKSGNWQNTPEQHELMLKYPDSSLRRVTSS